MSIPKIWQEGRTRHSKHHGSSTLHVIFPTQASAPESASNTRLGRSTHLEQITKPTKTCSSSEQPAALPSQYFFRRCHIRSINHVGHGRRRRPHRIPHAHSCSLSLLARRAHISWEPAPAKPATLRRQSAPQPAPMPARFPIPWGGGRRAAERSDGSLSRPPRPPTRPARLSTGVPGAPVGAI